MLTRTCFPIIHVSTGQAKIAGPDALLQSTPLGSCVAVVLLDPVRSIGAMAHIMLPGRAPENLEKSDRFRYAADAVDWMVEALQQRGVRPASCGAALIGGGNVLQRPDDTICNANIQSVRQWGDRHRLRIVACCLGGQQRRRAILDTGQRSILCSRGDGSPAVLWRSTSLAEDCTDEERSVFP
ncbi:MAG: chemotaxis protein CheD [Sedimentisphaerales bacterium]|nr:chemotaxis protein CheD [Sedimentisphaerales bacterium]